MTSSMGSMQVREWRHVRVTCTSRERKRNTHDEREYVRMQYYEQADG